MTKEITNFPTNIRIQYFDNTTQTNCAINRSFSTKEEFIAFTKRLQNCNFCTGAEALCGYAQSLQTL